jgi:hypothetical protein
MYKVIPVAITRDQGLSQDELQELTFGLGLMASDWSDFFKRYYDKAYSRAKTVFNPQRPAPPEDPPYAQPPAPPVEPPSQDDGAVTELLNTVREINEKFQRLLELLPELHRASPMDPSGRYAPVPDGGQQRRLRGRF